MLARELLTTIDELISSLSNSNDGIENIYSDYCINKLKNILTQIDKAYPNTPLNADIAAPLVEFLALHYRITKHTNATPTLSFQQPYTIACLTAAQTLEKIVKVNRYKLLHPELEVFDYVASGSSLSDDSHEISSFIMSDDGKRVIEVQACLAFAENDGVLKYTCLVDGQTTPLLKTEAERVINYSAEAKKYWESITYKVQVETRGESFGAMITTLINNLREGGKKRKGEEYKAGHDANMGIIHFFEWFSQLETDEKELLFKISYSHHTFKKYYDRLISPANYSDTNYCVEVISSDLDTMLTHNKQLFDVYPKKFKLSASAPKFQDAVRSMEGRKLALAKTMTTQSPKPIYANIALTNNMAELVDLQYYVSAPQWQAWFEKYLEICTPQERLAVAKKFASAINIFYAKSDTFNRLTKRFSVDEIVALVDILESAKEKPANTFKGYQFYFDSIKDSGKKNTLLQAKYSLITSFEDLFELVSIIELKQRVEYTNKHLKYIDLSDKFWRVVDLLPNDEHTFKFIMQFSRYITDPNKFVRLALKFPEPYQSYLFILFTKACFKSREELSLCLRQNDTSVSLDTFDYYRTLTITNGNDLHDLLTKLATSQRQFIAEHYQSVIQRGYQLVRVLLQLERSKRYAYITPSKGFIEGSDLGNIIGITDFKSDEEKLQFAESLIDKVSSDKELADVLKHFSFNDGCYLMQLATSKSVTISNPSSLVNNSLFCTPRSIKVKIVPQSSAEKESIKPST